MMTGENSTTTLDKTFVNCVADSLNGITLDTRQEEIMTVLPSKQYTGRHNLHKVVGLQRKRATKEYMEERSGRSNCGWRAQVGLELEANGSDSAS